MATRETALTVRYRHGARGFTLVELLTAVAITGILAAIGTMLVRKHFNSAKMSEAAAVIQSIRSAEEARRSESGSYVMCSFSSDTPWYPDTPDGKYRPWRNESHADWNAWRQLDVSRPEGTQFGFLVHAGNGSTTVNLLGQTVASPIPVPLTASKPGWTTPKDPWYVIQAAGDVDKDGTYSRMLAASFNGELYTENDGE